MLNPADRIALIDGDIGEMAPVASFHIGAVLTLNQRLIKAALAAVMVSVRSPIQTGG